MYGLEICKPCRQLKVLLVRDGFMEDGEWLLGSGLSAMEMQSGPLWSVKGGTACPMGLLGRLREGAG